MVISLFLSFLEFGPDFPLIFQRVHRIPNTLSNHGRHQPGLILKGTHEQEKAFCELSPTQQFGKL
jgi:hypothetical protein